MGRIYEPPAPPQNRVHEELPAQPGAPPARTQQVAETTGTGAALESIFLQPVAAPAILGLFGYAVAQSAVAAGLIGFYPASVGLYIAPFAALLGGVAQFASAMWAFRARDGLGTGMLGVWGSFWIAYGLLNLLFATGVLVQPVGVFPGIAFVFAPMAAVTYVGAAAAARVNLALCATLALLATGSAVGSAAFLTGSTGVTAAAGWLFMAAAAGAWYTASGLLLQAVYHRQILPIGLRKPAGEFTTARGEPGIFH